MASGEAILGASVGSGVTARASTAFGNSAAGNVLSGVAGVFCWWYSRKSSNK